MVKCKYAFDVEDEYCETCNGLNMMVDGNEVSCSECLGYEPEETSVPNEPEKSTITQEKVENNINTKEDNKITSETKLKPSSTITTETSTTMLRYMSGASVEHNGIWYKFECCEERKLPEGLSPEQVKEEREKLWAQINSEVDSQIEDCIKN